MKNKFTRDQLDEEISNATKKFFTELEDNQKIEVPHEYVQKCIQSNIDTTILEDFDSLEEVYEYFLTEYQSYEAEIIETLENL